MPGLYVRDAGGVSRKYRELHEAQSGVDRKLREMYAGDTGGVQRRIYTAAPPITWRYAIDVQSGRGSTYSITSGSDYSASYFCHSDGQKTGTIIGDITFYISGLDAATIDIAEQGRPAQPSVDYYNIYVNDEEVVFESTGHTDLVTEYSKTLFDVSSIRIHAKCHAYSNGPAGYDFYINVNTASYGKFLLNNSGAINF